jgi:hypothetical protein
MVTKAAAAQSLPTKKTRALDALHEDPHHAFSIFFYFSQLADQLDTAPLML